MELSACVAGYELTEVEEISFGADPHPMVLLGLVEETPLCPQIRDDKVRHRLVRICA